MQGLNTDQTLKQLIFATKGATFCAKEQGDFLLCRATAAGAHGEPEICESKVANFLQCYSDL
jgi:hypothetical protein